MRRIKKKEPDLEGSSALVWLMQQMMNRLKPDMDRDVVTRFVDINCDVLHEWAEGSEDPESLQMFVFEDDGAKILAVVFPKGEQQGKG